MGGLGKAVSITWPVLMKLKTGVSELSATETDGRDLVLGDVTAVPSYFNPLSDCFC